MLLQKCYDNPNRSHRWRFARVSHIEARVDTISGNSPIRPDRSRSLAAHWPIVHGLVIS